MGRLFWKVFLVFWLTMLGIAALATVAVITLQQSSDDDDERQVASPSVIAMDRRSDDQVRQFAAILQFGGRDALTAFARSEAMSDAARSSSGHPHAAAGHPRMMAGRSDAMPHEADGMPGPAVRSPALPGAFRDPRAARARVFVVDEQGRDWMQRIVPPKALERARALGEDEQARGVRKVTTPEGERFVLFVPRPVDQVDRRPRRFSETFERGMLLGAGLSFSIIFSAALAWYLARPIGVLRDGFRRVTAGDLDTRVAPLMGNRRDELADLGVDFDRTTERLSQLLSSQRRLLHDVSHELRSPLARIQAAIGLLQQDPTKAAELSHRIETESQRLDLLIGEILTLSRLNEPMGHGVAERTDLNALLADLVEDARFEAEAEHKHVELTGALAEPIVVVPQLIERAVENLLRNAIRYTPVSGVVRIAYQAEGVSDAPSMAGADGDRRGDFGGDIDENRSRQPGEPQATSPGSITHVVILVEDDGPGVPEPLLESVLEPFVRAPTDAAKGLSTDGFGLGLAIARRAVQIHRGTLTLSNRAEGGLRATVRLPVDFTREA